MLQWIRIKFVELVPTLRYTEISETFVNCDMGFGSILMESCFREQERFGGT